MRETWDRIERWLRAHAPELADNLGAPASQEALQAIEVLIGVTLPEEMAASYRIHDGERSAALPPLLGAWRLMRTEEVESQWSMLAELARNGTFADAPAEPDRGIADGWWNPRWVPVAHNDAGDFRCVDLAPAADGVPGQMIAYGHVDPRRVILAPSFGTWLGAFADDLESGIYRVEDGGLERQGEAGGDAHE